MKSSLAIAPIILLGLTNSVLALDHKPSSLPPAAPYVPGRILVEFKEGTPGPAMAAAHSHVGGREIRHYANFERLSPTTAQRVMRFWQVRRTDDGR